MHTAYVERLKTLGDKPNNTSTTHFCAADSEGNMVALTQTLMSLFGSCVMLPKTGITMNNGMLWFDPEANRPNSIAAGKRPLCNICPVVVVKDGQPWFCIGASGGRRIVPAVTQLSLMLIDRGLDVETAFHQPRVDVSGVGPIRVNRLLRMRSSRRSRRSSRSPRSTTRSRRSASPTRPASCAIPGRAR
jgi:gamma-glutamyltranspeptidase/glutathione hydrolase